MSDGPVRIPADAGDKHRSENLINRDRHGGIRVGSEEANAIRVGSSGGSGSSGTGSRRRISPLLAITHQFGGCMFQIVLVAMAFCVYQFGFDTYTYRFNDAWDLETYDGQTQATITEIQESYYNYDDENIWEIRFSYAVGEDRDYSGLSYSDGLPNLKVGDVVPVQYFSELRFVSRLEGYFSAPRSMSMFWADNWFWLAGCVFLVWFFSAPARLTLRTLRSGVATWAEQSKVEPLASDTDGTGSFRYVTYTWHDEQGGEHSDRQIMSSKQLTPEAHRVRCFYRTERPGSAILLTPRQRMVFDEGAQVFYFRDGAGGALLRLFLLPTLLVLFIMYT